MGKESLRVHEPPNILLTGTYCAANKGNAAITIGAIAALRKVLPGARITLLSAFTQMDAAAYPDVPVVACSRRSPTIFLLAALASLLRCIESMGCPFPSRCILSPELRQYRCADLIVDISGDAISENYGFLVGLSHLMPLLIGLMLGKPMLVCGQSLGPFHYLSHLAKYVLKRTSIVAVREKHSLHYLKELRVEGSRIEVTCDPAFLMEPARGAAIGQLLAREDLLPQNGPYLGVNASPLHGHKVSGIEPGAATEGFIAKMAHCCNRWIETLGCKVVLLPHVTGPERKRDERVAVAELYRRIDEKANARPILVDYSTQELKAIVAGMSLFVGVRMHANIAALSSGVPVVALAYSHKTVGIMSMLGQQHWVLDIREFSGEALFRKVEAAWAERRTIKKELQGALPAARDGALRNAWLAKQLLEREKPERF
jgi:colanic acid/amylovoran biosynthesis protein